MKDLPLSFLIFTIQQIVALKMLTENDELLIKIYLKNLQINQLYTFYFRKKIISVLYDCKIIWL